jgi:hypothetical protein
MIKQDLLQEISCQPLPVLLEIRELIEDLIVNSRSQSNGLPKAGEATDVLDKGTVTYRLEWVSCGKGCKGCPHGPYWYGYWKEGGRTRSKYIGKSLESMSIDLEGSDSSI